VSLTKSIARCVDAWHGLARRDSAGRRDGDTKVACILHAHLLLLFKNLGVDDVNKTVASAILSAQVSSV